jgi:TolB protein
MNHSLTRQLTRLLPVLIALVLSVACFSSASPQIAFVSEVDGDPEIFLLDPETGETTPLTRNESRDFSPRWSPDRRRIVYLTDESGNQEINQVDQKGESTHRVTYNVGIDESPLWSPDGERFAFISHQDGNPEIYVMMADGSNPTRITFNSVEDYLGQWSPDGEWLVFYAWGAGAGPGLWLRNPRGVNLIHLTEGQDTEPAWSPDGQRIAFVRREGGNPDIYIAEKPGSGNWQDAVKETRLTEVTAADISPVWSPDSKSLAFVSYRGGNAEIYTMRADGSKQERLTNNGADDVSPVWSPDGKHIAFVSYLYDEGEIYVMEADGSRQRRLTNNESEDAAPDW